MKHQHRVLGLLALLSIITYLDRVCIAVAGPRMQDSLHITPQAWGWVTSVFFLSYSAFEIPTGALGDRVRPRRVLTRIVLWWSAFTAIARWIPAAKRARAWGMVLMTSQIGAAISPLLVVPIQARYGWQASFYLFGFLGVIWSAVWYAWFRDSPTEKAGINSMELQEIGAEPPVRHGGLPWAQALRNGALWRIAALAACYVYVISFFQSWLQTYLVRGHGYTDAALVLSSLPYVVGGCANGLGGVASDWLVRRFGLKTGRRALGVFGLSFAAIFMAATIVTTSGAWALVFLSLSYAGILAQQPNLCAVILDTGRKHAGAVFGFMNTAANAASAVSSVAFGYQVAYFGNYNAPFIPMVLMLCVGTWLWLKVDPAHQLFEEEGPLPGTAPQLAA